MNVKDVVCSDGNDCERKMNKVQLMNICKSAGYSPLKTARHSNKDNLAYHAAKAKKPEAIIYTNCFIIYLNITKSYPICIEYIDGLDWTKIYLLIQHEP